MPKKSKNLCVDDLRHAEYYGMQPSFDELYRRSMDGDTFTDLMDMILSRDNILLAYRNIKANGGSYTAGTDNKNISDIGCLPPETVVEKVRFIVTGSQHGYRPKPVRRKDIPKPNGKTRPLGIPCIWDRLIQQCIKQVLEPICEAKFSDNSYGFRPNRSVEHAMQRTYTMLQRMNLHYVIEFDIKGFFDNVNHSMTELYTMQRYLQYDRLQEMGMSHFDCWASRFGETVTALELAPEGTGYRARTRFSKFFNLPELMTLFKEVADIKTSDQLNLPTPEVEYHTVVAKPTEHQQDMVAALSERAAEVHAGNVDPSVDNMLKITSDGRKLGLDQRIINPLLPDQEGTKVNQCVSNIMKVWRDGETDKLTQLVFCDISTPKPAPSRKVAKGVTGNLDNPELHALETSIPLPEEQPGFTVYDDIRSKLIAQGVPPEQIAFIHEANTEVRKKELFAKVRTGQVRVLLGSTSKMGAGTNVQDRLVAIHDLDCPWRPGDLAQRKGRIERQGNQNPLVHVFRYVTEGTFDAYLWQTVENKQKFISQIMSSKSPVRSCDDVDETALSFAEIKALCAGDPRIKERMDLDVEVSRLKLMKADHQSKQFRMEDNLLKYFPEQIELNKGFIRGLETDMQTLAAHPHPEDGFAGMEIRGDVLTDKENAGAALLDAVTEVKGTEPVQIGSYRGFAMTVTFDAFRKEYELSLRGEMTHKAILGADPRGNLVRIDNALGQLQARLDAAHAQLDNLHQQQAAAQAEVGKPFPFEEELRVKTARLVLLDTELNMDGKKRPPAQREIAKSARPSVLEGLKKQVPTRTTEKKHKNHEEVL